MGSHSKYGVREAGFCFGLWRVLGHEQRGTAGFYYQCECTGCGKRADVSRQNLELEKSRSCVPCANARLRAEQNGVYERFSAPRDLVDRLANRYYAILSRCREGGHDRYAGRGIRCEFRDVYHFVEYALGLPNCDQSGYQIDRVDNDGNYAEGNLRFVTASVNNRNKEHLHYVEWLGQRITATEFRERFCPQYRDVSTVLRKLRRGVSPQQIIFDQANCRGAYLRHPELGTAQPVPSADGLGSCNFP